MTQQRNAPVQVAAHGLRTGEEYIESIRDGREVWVSGERVEDIPEHAAFRGSVESVAAAYDLQHDPEAQPVLTTESPTSGRRVALTFKPPRTRDDLVERRRMIELFSRQTGGTMGRLPEYGGAFAVGLSSLGPELGDEQAARVSAWVEQCRENDSCVVTSFVDPQVDRSRPAEETGLLHLIEERSDGIVISGCKSVATLAPAANEFLIITAPRRFSSADEVVYVSVPVESAGLRFFCREPFAPGRTRPDAPLSTRFDELDAWALFDNVFVPYDRVFVSKDVDLSKVPGFFAKILAWPWYHNLVRVSVKAELLAGISTLMAQYLNTWQFPQVQELVSEVIAYQHGVKSFVLAGEAEAVQTESGIIAPNPAFMSVGKVFAVEKYPRMLEIVRELAGQGIIMAPRAADLEQEEIGPLVRSYYEAHGVDADDRIRLFRLAWDIACDSFAGRQALFELFNAGGLGMSKLGIANKTDKTPYIELARRLAGIDS
jgi:4-hydroxyphenylacetate 3-monooxygenase